MYRNMKNRTYDKPTTQVVKLQYTGMLMTSVLNANRSGYGTASAKDGTDLEWD